MTEQQLRERGYPGGDAQLLAAYVKHFGAEPTWPVFEPGPDWKREILFNALAMEIGAGKSVRLGGSIGPWKRGEPTGYEPGPTRRKW